MPPRAPLLELARAQYGPGRYARARTALVNSRDQCPRAERPDMAVPLECIATETIDAGVKGAIEPTRPWFSPSGPDEKVTLPFGPLIRAHKPSIIMCEPSGLVSLPSNLPVTGLNTLIDPSPKLPTRSWPANGPNFAGAIIMPHGALRTLFDTRRLTRWPCVVKRSRYPRPGPSTSSCVPRFCWAYVT